MGSIDLSDLLFCCQCKILSVYLAFLQCSNMLPVAVRLSVILVVSAAPVDGHPAPAVAAAVARVAGGVHAEDGGGAVLPPGGRLATH